MLVKIKASQAFLPKNGQTVEFWKAFCCSYNLQIVDPLTADVENRAHCVFANFVDSLTGINARDIGCSHHQGANGL